MASNDGQRFLYGTAWKEDRTAELTELAIQMGFRSIDTANQRWHYFEAGVGEGLAAAYRSAGVTRTDLFLQTKFTYQAGQDHRLPYDPEAGYATQVAQSMASSLEHLGTDYVDSYLLHGPLGDEWAEIDDEVWGAMGRERDAGRTRLLGVSNVSLGDLQALVAAHGSAPEFVQNRCFARSGWDLEVRRFCQDHQVTYQGFSLLTANRQVLKHPYVNELASRKGVTPAQVVFAFAHAVGMLPMTGTKDPEHMRQDLASCGLELSAEDINGLETLVALFDS